MKSLFKDRFGQDKFLIGMVHTLALPGSPLYDRPGGMRRIVGQARTESRILRDAGFHAVLYCNESDMPYDSVMAPETNAAMADVIAECRSDVDLPYGVNMLIDAVSSIAVAHATGAQFVRCFLTGSYVGDFGHVTPNGSRALRLRAELEATNIAIICNVTPGFSVTLDTRPVALAASGAVFVGLADAVCVSGPAAGMEADLSIIKEVADSVPDTPVVVGTGVSAENIDRLATAADAFIIGTSIKVDGRTLNPVDPQRAEALTTALLKDAA